MNNSPARTLPIKAITMILCTILVSLIACDQSSQPAVTGAVSGASPTRTLTRNEIAATFNAQKVDFNNKVSTHDAQIATAALATASAIAGNPNYVPPTPMPTSTMVMGMFACNSEGERAYFYVSCWRGVVNGELVTVASGGDKVPGPPPPTGEPTGIPALGRIRQCSL